MTKKTKIIITAAALLTGCLCGCAPDTDSNGTSQSGNVSSSGDAAAPSLFKTVADNVKGDLQTKFEGSDNIPSLTPMQHCALEAESGWYYNVKGSTHYWDKATNQNVLLCARPECTHNTEYCTASNSRYPGDAKVYYDGYLYGLSGNTEQAKKDGQPMLPQGEGDILLMRYAPDGTTLDKLLSLKDTLPEMHETCVYYLGSIIGHKGALWISLGVSYIHYSPIEDNQYSETEYCGYSLLHYDLSADKLTTVYSFPLTADASPSPPTAMQAVGDYVYFSKDNKDWGDPLNGGAVYRVHIRTGAIEEVLSDLSTDVEVGAYAVNGRQLVYSKAFYENGKSVPKAMLLNLETGESKLLLPEDLSIANLTCTEDAVVIVPKGTPELLQIYDFEGNLLQTLPTLQMSEEPVRRVITAISSDTLYAIFAEPEYVRIHSISLQEAIQGNASWQLAMQYQLPSQDGAVA